MKWKWWTRFAFVITMLQLWVQVTFKSMFLKSELQMLLITIHLMHIEINIIKKLIQKDQT